MNFKASILWRNIQRVESCKSNQQYVLSIMHDPFSRDDHYEDGKEWVFNWLSIKYPQEERDETNTT